MAESYISELGDSLSHGVANTNGDRVKIIAPKLYNDGNGNHPSIATALSGKAASNHTHGNIANGGTLQTNEITIANGDKLVVTDASDSNKVACASLTFDGATTNQMLSKKGEWSDTIAKARGVVDYGGAPSDAIEIGWSGAAITSPTDFAVYTNSAHGYKKAIKDCSLANVRKAINGTSVGSTAVPVFINANGAPQVCTDDFVHDGDVTSTYSSTGTAPVNGTAVASALGSYLPPSGSISAGDDLNSYNTANRNYICTAANSSSVSNRPSGASGAFELEVIRGTDSSCTQIYYSRDDVNFNYIRKYTGSKSWTSWEMMMSQDVSNKLNVDGSNATTDGVVAMMKKAPLNSTINVPADTEYYYSDGSDKSIVRRSIRNIWNYIKGKLGSAGSSDSPIYIENGVPKACDSVMPVSTIDSGTGTGYGVFVGGNPNCGASTRCFCAFLITATAKPDMTAHTYIGTFTFKAGKILKSDIKCLTGRPQYPLRIGVVFKKNTDSTYSVGLYVIPADKTVNTYANYKLTRVASTAFTWSVQAMTEDAYDDVVTISRPSLIPIPLYWESSGSNVKTTGGTWLPTFDKATIIDCRGYVDLSVQVDLSLIGQTTYVGTLSSYSITLVNSSGTEIIPSSLQQGGPMPRQITSTLNNALFTGTIGISCTHRFVFPITENSNLLAGYRPKITLPPNYPLDKNAQVSIRVQCNGIVLPYCPTNESF